MTLVSATTRQAARGTLLFNLALGACSAAGAAQVLIRVSGLTEPLGQVGCSLFAGASGFPMDNSGARNLWVPADAQGATCRFTDVPAGRYAVSVGHDRNGNKRVDTNFVGLPMEPWGVSNNARPTLRAPRFEEAAFQVAVDAQDVVVDIKVAK